MGHQLGAWLDVPGTRLTPIDAISAGPCFLHMCRRAPAWLTAELLNAQHPPPQPALLLVCPTHPPRSHDEYREGEEVLELPCGHNYHADCLLPWLETHNTCPGEWLAVSNAASGHAWQPMLATHVCSTALFGMAHALLLSRHAPGSSLPLHCGPVAMHNHVFMLPPPLLLSHRAVCRHELPAEDPQVEAERRRRAQQAPGSASSSRRQRPSEQSGGGRLADLLAGISSRWESFRDSMARPDEPADQDHASPSAGERASASGSASAGANAGAGRPAAQAQLAAAHAQQAAAAQAGSSGRFGTAGSSGRAGVEADGGASAATASARPAPASSTDGLRQRRESAAAAAERRLRGASATSLPSHPSQPTPPPARPAPPAGAARPAMPPHPAASRVQQQPPAVEEEEREEGGEGVVAGALLGGALGAVLGGALMLLGRRGQRDRS